MSTKHHLYPLLSVFIVCFLFSSCKKTTSTTADYSDASSSYSTTDNMFKDMNKVIGDAAADGQISGKNENSESNTCATVTLNPPDLTTFPKTVTIDFGTTGCTDQYFITRKGKLTAVFTDYLHHAGAHVHVTFDNYYVNGAKVEGTYDLANTTGITDPTRTFKDTVTNGKITTIDGKVCTWNSTRYSTQTAGFSTLTTLLDDEYTGGGHSSGIGFNGKTFDATSTNIVWKLACRWLVKGTVTIYSNNDPKPIVVDFGDGSCDNKYTATYDVYHVDLTFWY